MSVQTGRPQPIAFPSEATVSQSFAVPRYLGWIHANPAGVSAWTLPLLTTISEGSNLWIRNISAFAITLSAFAGNTVAGASSIVVPANTIAWLITDRSTDWKLVCTIPAGGQLVAGPSTFVQQTVNNTTAVTFNTNAGVVASATAYNTAANTISGAYQVNNSKVTATSSIQATVTNYTGTYVTNGMPRPVISGVTAGSFQVQIYNQHPANALNGGVSVSFLVV